MITAGTSFLHQIARVFVAITDKRHGPVPQGGEKEWPGTVLERLVFLHCDEVGVDMHFSLGTLGGDILHFARSVAIERFAPEHALNRGALRLVQFLRRGENPFDTLADPVAVRPLGLPLVVKKCGETRDGRRVSQDHSRPYSPEAPGP